MLPPPPSRTARKESGPGRTAEDGNRREGVALYDADSEMLDMR
jgi:hypothetical protein